MFEVLYLLFLIAMFVQGLISIYLSLYIWESPERLEEVAAPKINKKPKTSFTVLIPARHEEKVIAHTLTSIAQANYPKKLIEILVICEESDTKTIAEAKKAINSYNISNAKVVTFNDLPTTKPHGLNKGLWQAKNDVVVVFDAEDEVNQDIFAMANTMFLIQKPDVLQSGVQLMNYDSHWFSSHNVLEYYFWFKSRMHFHTKTGVVLLGGNTVFIKTAVLKHYGGWDETCLTEDAEIGVRLSANGAKMVAMYDPTYITKEETPNSLEQFIKQRTRWNQGFIQVLRLGKWKEYDSHFKQLFCVYTLAFPLIQTALFAITPIIFLFGLIDKLPIALSMISFLPILLICIQYTINAIAMHEFIHEQKLHNNRLVYATMLITFIPYQVLLGIGAIRATYREYRGFTNWEKTTHLGLHRELYDRIIFDPHVAV